MNKVRMSIYGAFLIATLFSNGIVQAAEDEEKEKTPDFIMDTSEIGESNNGTIRSEQLLELGSLTPGALTLEGEKYLKQGSIDRALTVLQRSVELAPMDMDSRTFYAQTLEKKLMMQKDKKDPVLFNFIIKQWYFVFQKSEYLDQKMQGWSRLKDLTGTVPKRFEKPQKYLARVLIPEDGSVKVKIGGNNPTPTKAIAHKKHSDFDDDFGNKDTIY